VSTADLAGRLWPVSLVRGLAALLLGMWVLASPPPSAGLLMRAVALFWIVDGVAVFGGSLAVASLMVNRLLLMLRGLAGIVTAVVMLALPLVDAFGPYKPGQLTLLLFVIPAVIIAIGLQVLGAVFDLFVCLEVRRLIPGEWTHSLSAAMSIVFGALLVAVILVQPPVLGRGVGAVGLVGGLAVVVGALRLRPSRDPSLSALPH
jgi:uncharacterized membrane protein HdeD (DUF308 family)